MVLSTVYQKRECPAVQQYGEGDVVPAPYDFLDCKLGHQFVSSPNHAVAVAAIVTFNRIFPYTRYTIVKLIKFQEGY